MSVQLQEQAGISKIVEGRPFLSDADVKVG